MGDKLAPTERHRFVHNGQVVYEWDQTLDEVNLYVQMPPGVKARQLTCEIQPGHLSLGIKGNPPYLDHDLAGRVKKDSSFWTVEDGTVHVTLQKMDKGQTWPSAIAGHGELNPFSVQSDQKRLMLERFQQENPGFDFSGADFSGQCPDPRTFMGGLKTT